MSAFESFPTNGSAIAGPVLHARTTKPNSDTRDAETGASAPAHAGFVAAVQRNDWELIRLAAAGDSVAQEQLFKVHTPRLYRTAFGILRNRQDAEDVVQDSWCRAFAGLGTFEGRAAFSTWLTRVAINSALMFRRRKSFRIEVSLNEILENESQSFFDEALDEPNPEEMHAASELNIFVEARIRRLSPRIRTAFRMCSMEEFSIAEAAETLGIGKTTLKSRVTRGRRKVSRALRELLSTTPSSQAVPRVSSARSHLPQR